MVGLLTSVRRFFRMADDCCVASTPHKSLGVVAPRGEDNMRQQSNFFGLDRCLVYISVASREISAM